MFASGCASAPQIVTRTETVTLTKEVLIPVPEALTKQIEIPQVTDNMDTLGLGLLYKQTVTRLTIANGQLAEIAGLK